MSFLLKIVKRIFPATASMLEFSKAGFSFLPKMPQGCPWVKQQHARSGISHHFPYFLFHVGTIAMNRALLARAFLFSEFTIAQSFVCIFKEFFAVVAEHFVALFVPTINVHHAFHRFLFLFDACHADFGSLSGNGSIKVWLYGNASGVSGRTFFDFHLTNQRSEITTEKIPTRCEMVGGKPMHSLAMQM